MIKTLLARQLARFERLWGYDASYMHHMLNVSPASFMKFGFVTSMVDAKAAPAEALVAVGVVGTLAEDCGPCTQLGIDKAAAAGVDPRVLRAILAGDEAAMGPDAGLAWRFAQASLARDLEAADAVRDQVVARWGDRGLVALSLALTASRMYPTLKYALGYGKACSKVTVAGVAAPVAHRPIAA